VLIAGVDGCKAGWLCITRQDTGLLLSEIYATAAALCEQSSAPDLIAIDIPIGLADVGPRSCDLIARKMLGRRGCCVFTAPIRSLLTAKTYQEANATRRQVEGKGLAKQAWEISAKIREVDGVAKTHPNFQERVREVHPEVCFTAWNRNVPILTPKKSPAGRETRAALVAQHFGPSAFSTVRQRHVRTDVGDDDINDAFAALWTAGRIIAGTACLIPERPSRDSLGLRMEMWY
jgi:predicted RNase H-like nuclease